MKKSVFSLTIIFFFSVLQLVSQNIKGFYVDGFYSILGDTAKEDSLLLFAKNNGFNYLTLYEVHLVNSSIPLTNVTTAQNFANFINKAKTQYNITEIGVAAENFWFFDNVIKVYNQQHPLTSQKVDVYNFEFEFWVSSSVTTGTYYCITYLQPNGFSCDTAGAFGFYKKELRKIDSLANLTGQKSEAYFGFFNTGQGKQIVQTGVDRILLSVYIPSANYSQIYQYNYIKPRLQYLASANTNVNIIPIYSAEPSFMQTWINANPFFLPYTDFTNSLTAETGIWKDYIQPEGIQWFAYNFLPKINLNSVSEKIENKEISMYPNPANDNLTIEFNHQDIESKIEITNVLGEVVYSHEKKETITVIDLKQLSKGIYFVRFYSNRKFLTNKIIKE